MVYVRDKNESLNEKISDLKLELNNLKAKDDLQELVINQIGKQMDELIPKLIQKLELKKQEDE